MTEKKSISKNPDTKAHRRKRNKTAALGAGILIFALTGFCVVMAVIIKSAVGYVKDFMGPNEDAAFFEKYLEPVVMFDPDTFTDISKAKPQWQLETAIWAALDENEKNGSYASTSDGREILPVKDVASNMKKYFGISNPKYMTFSDGNFTYEYSRKEQCFYIPLIAVTSYYIPHVKKISKGFNSVTLIVDYQTGKNWGQDEASRSALSTEKTMRIRLKGSRGRYTVKAIEKN